MENFNPGKNNEQKNESALNKVSKLTKTILLSKLLDNSKIDKTLADNLYDNRTLEEEIIAPNKFYSGFTPSLPKETKIIEIYGSPYANIGDKMYYIREFQGGFDLVDNTKDFIPFDGLSDREYKRRAILQKKYGLSNTTEAAPRDDFYRYNESTDDLDNWIIHNDKGIIKKDAKSGKYNTWWRKGEPYKAFEARSLLDKPIGRHLFAKQSALESSIGRPLNEHRELIGDVIKEGSVQDGGITITPTSEEDLQNLKDLKSFKYNPITKSMEKEIFYNPDKPKDEKENLKGDEDTKI